MQKARWPAHPCPTTAATSRGRRRCTCSTRCSTSPTPSSRRPPGTTPSTRAPPCRVPRTRDHTARPPTTAVGAPRSTRTTSRCRADAPAGRRSTCRTCSSSTTTTKRYSSTGRGTRTTWRRISRCHTSRSGSRCSSTTVACPMHPMGFTTGRGRRSRCSRGPRPSPRAALPSRPTAGTPVACSGRGTTVAAPAQGPLRRRPRPPAAPRCAPPPSRSCRASLRPHSFLAPTWPPSLPPQRGPPRRREAPTVATPQRWRLPAIERTTAAWCRPAPPRCRRAPRVAQWAPWSTRHCSTRRSTMRPPSRSM
mmetsp:Transcript_8272/g.24726  ORF Transcript_8272/g.24726 Transcript_8272/m.24726 type:complete len:307 (-) Transcript_8272:175-1095(-)